MQRLHLYNNLIATKIPNENLVSTGFNIQGFIVKELRAHKRVWMMDCLLTN